MSDPVFEAGFFAHTRRGLDQPAPGGFVPAGAQPAERLELPGAGGAVRLTPPGMRPLQAVQAFNVELQVGTMPIPIQDGSMMADAVVLAVPNGGNTVFLGYGEAVTPASGIPIIANVPVELSVINQREQWELQRALEWIAAAVAGQPMTQYRAPRLALDLSRFFLVSAAAQSVAVMVFLSPEGQ